MRKQIEEPSKKSVTRKTCTSERKHSMSRAPQVTTRLPRIHETGERTPRAENRGAWFESLTQKTNITNAQLASKLRSIHTSAQRALRCSCRNVDSAARIRNPSLVRQGSRAAEIRTAEAHRATPTHTHEQIALVTLRRFSPLSLHLRARLAGRGRGQRRPAGTTCGRRTSLRRVT